MNDAEMGRFLRLLAHDLQNQVGAIDLNLQVLPSMLDDGDPALVTLTPFMSRASAAAHELSDSLSDVQAFARAVSREDDGLPINLARVDLGALVRDHARVIAGVAKERRIQVKTGGDAHATGEVDALRRALKIMVNEALRGLLPDSTLEMIVSTQPVPVIELKTSLDGLFDDSRQTLPVYMVRELLRWSQGRLLLNGACAQLMFQPG